ncbi:hypothetical protein AKJ09_07396 [Labilithrix luteola]|uniref:Uncharacterized protein n=1 Tax=Labilithrix luteola TaxID=1391654 RepID=A0A0K1Q4T4_9BACT|nr:hypothetical protein [Labilithrix luteola]AKV00733.1 hypothetical protein AKJ09_07396 [Labilithrix luteola]
MRLADLDVFDGRQVAWFERLFGAAILANVATEAASGMWAVHQGRLYPWRHLPILPLWSTTTLAIVWALLSLAGILVVLGSLGRRGLTGLTGTGFRLAVPLLFLSVLEHYSNHGALLFLVGFYVALGPPSIAEGKTAELPNMGLVRAQIVLVYVFGAVNKILHGFACGQSLVNLFGWPLSIARVASVLVIAVELVLPCSSSCAPSSDFQA